MSFMQQRYNQQQEEQEGQQELSQQQHNSTRRQVKHQVPSPTGQADLADRSRMLNSSDYHNLPEITWNSPTFNFDNDDFAMQNHMLSQNRTVVNPNPSMMNAYSQQQQQIAQQQQQRQQQQQQQQSQMQPQRKSSPPTTTQSERQEEQGRASPPKKAPRVCSHCGKTFSRTYDLHRHESSHSDERRFACDYPGCTKKYKLRQDLKAHERSAHEGRGGGGAVVLGHWRGFEDRLYSM